MGNKIKAHPKMHCGVWTTIFIILIIGLYAVHSKKINDDTDITFDDNLDLKSNHLHVASKRSLNQLNRVTDKDVEEMLHNDLENNDENWLWRHVSRVKRSIFDWLDTEDEKSTTKAPEVESKIELLEEDEKEQSKKQPSIFDWLDTEKEKSTTKAPEVDEESKNEVLEKDKEQSKKHHSTHKKHHRSQKKHRRKEDNLQQQNHENHHAGHETLSNNINNRVEERTLLVPRLHSMDRLKRQFADDDDDDDDDEDEPDNIWDIEENEIVSSGWSTSDNIKYEYASKPHRLFRLKLTIEEVWSPNYDNKDSVEYKNISQNIGKAIEEVYNINKHEDNRIFAHVVDIRYEDIFRLRVTADINSEKGISGHELNRIFEEEVDEKSKIGDFTVRKDDFFQLLVVEENSK